MKDNITDQQDKTKWKATMYDEKQKAKSQRSDDRPPFF
jgi:hypothetical protein